MGNEESEEKDPYRGFSPASASVFAIVIWIFIVWAILHGITSIWFKAYFFYVDTFFIAFLGSLSSYLFSIGDPKARYNAPFIFGKLATSPFVAVVLVIILSEISIGFEGITTNTQSEIVKFTLEGATNELKMAFAFTFGFFGEVAVKILRKLISG